MGSAWHFSRSHLHEVPMRRRFAVVPHADLLADRATVGVGRT
jgi:hypothetical protein